LGQGSSQRRSGQHHDIVLVREPARQHDCHYPLATGALHEDDIGYVQQK
jgi:hypothetical protein